MPRPTPLGVPLEVRGTIKEIKGRKVVVTSTLSANGEVCARGEVVAAGFQTGAPLLYFNRDWRQMAERELQR